ncbi:glycine cleavage system protein GcvH [Candidatus Poriferisodalis sp.]|uniref:glycine cleavage system protein GcvH n=1 Tax=Candidatus Poriferisodalis sp. TaxID=3101277 RepID=UPI003B022593
MEIPAELRYSADHEWVRPSDAGMQVGITDFAQDALGDVVYVELPEIGAQVAADEAMCEIESTKSVSDIFAPLSGEIAEVNVALEDEPQLVNESPYGDGWICVITPKADTAQADAEMAALLDADGYAALIAEDV